MVALASSDVSWAHRARWWELHAPNRPRRVLIATDPLGPTKRLAELFRGDGWLVRTIDQEKLPMRVLRYGIAHRRAPDLIVLPLPMASARRAFRTLLGWIGSHIPLVVATGDPDPRRCAAQINAVGYFAEPINLRDLDRLLDALVLTGTRVSREEPAGRPRIRRPWLLPGPTRAFRTSSSSAGGCPRARRRTRIVHRHVRHSPRHF
jgi:hypothetical protein